MHAIPHCQSVWDQYIPCVCVYIYIYTFIHICVHNACHPSLPMCLGSIHSMCVYIYIHMHVCIRTYVHVYIAHAYTHTRAIYTNMPSWCVTRNVCFSSYKCRPPGEVSRVAMTMCMYAYLCICIHTQRRMHEEKLLEDRGCTCAIEY